jgi:hypothetical protein
MENAICQFFSAVNADRLFETIFMAHNSFDEHYMYDLC